MINCKMKEYSGKIESQERMTRLSSKFGSRLIKDSSLAMSTSSFGSSNSPQRTSKYRKSAVRYSGNYDLHEQIRS